MLRLQRSCWRLGLEEKIMPFEKGGRADKQGNSYEINCIIYELLKVLNEKNYSVIIEALGIDEVGTDILVTTFDDQKEHQQCKARNGSKEYWNISDLKEKNIFSTWKTQLNRGSDRKVALVSPMSCSFLFDLHKRACNTSGEAEDFYSEQIMKSSKEFQQFYRSFCSEMGLKSDKTDDISKSIDYLKRISYNQISEYELQECINCNIQYLFSSERNRVYDAFLSLIEMGDIYGKEITQTVLFDWFTKRKITFRLNDGDKRIAPRIQEINQEYRQNFIPLLDGLEYRKEFDDCIDAIENEKAIIISGNAGSGKSGCTEAILNYCEEKRLPYIAIKLDRRIPHINCDVWGKELGFPSSIIHAIHSISKNEKAVIILDQLDALRWTQANSSEALTVCMELIRQIKCLNYEREKKIIPVFVCRTYDLENDNNINLLFKNQKETENSWKIVKVGNFEKETVKKIVGENYEQLSPKLQKILKIPSNLYIWQHLDKEDMYGECLTTSHLIDKWFEQICRRSVMSGLQQGAINKAKKDIVRMLDKIGRLYVPKQLLDIEEAVLDYLISSEIIIIQNNRVGFVHQSILDYFMSQSMIEKYFDGQNIENIIGEKEKQNPGRRYQVQMFLQNILKFDSDDFIKIGEKMLISDDIRYYVKYIFYEILGQIEEPDDNITQFIVSNCENDIYGKFLLNNTIFTRKQYITILRNYGILERWYSDPEKKIMVFDLLQSITPNLDKDDIAFIRKHALKSADDDKQFMRCFFFDIMEESNELFELRMMFYEYYPDYAKEIFINIKNMMEKFEQRAIRLISFWLQNKIKSQGKYVYRYEEELVDLDNDFLIENAEFILDELLPYIPKENGKEINYSNWSGKYTYKRGVERACVELVKKATIILIDKSPDSFWRYYELYMGKGYHIFNEIILTGLAHLPSEYSNRIMCYLSTDLDKKIFDYTSEAEDELGLVQEILKVHGSICGKDELSGIENAICSYISPNASEWYKRRIELNKQKKYSPVYWSFWGDLQYKLLQCLPQDRINKKTKDLLKVLDRRFYKVPLRYIYPNSHSGWVQSPVTGENISHRQWLQIITNNKLNNHRNFKEVKGGFIESSCETYASDFQEVVKQHPQEMIEMVLNNKKRVLDVFIDALFLGIELSEELENIDSAVIEELLLNFPCDMKNHRALYFCGIVEKMNTTNLTSKMIDQLINIALNHSDFDKVNRTNLEDREMKSCDKLQNDAWNSVRASAARAIGKLLWSHEELFSRFKEIIEKLTRDDSAAVRYATLYALWPSYNINREWAEKKILYLYETDIRMASFHDSKNMFFHLYPKYKERILNIIKKCFESDDKKLVEIGGYSVCEFYIWYGEFEAYMCSVGSKSEEQIKTILDMAVSYLKVDKYREVAQNIILIYKNIDTNVENILSRMFYNNYVDSKHDKEFLKEFMKTKVSRSTVRAFVNYLDGNAVSVVDYADIIIQLCENVLQMEIEDLKKQWGIENEISKLIIFLYDETANSRKAEYKQIADKCLDLWDIMFERQLGSTREISRKLMQR